MENKPQNVFEKLDKQGEQIDDLSSKLEGISINDLYALAKRTWNYGDYITAQKYYNHISLLKPLDWEAPFMASLCNFRGRHEIVFWEDSLGAKEKLFVSTLQYILSLDLDSEKRDLEIKKCTDIICSELNKTIDQYYDNKESFDIYSNNYSSKIENSLYNLYNDLIKIDLKEETLSLFVLNKLLDIIEKEKVILQNISETIFKDYYDKVGRTIVISYDELINNNKSIMPKDALPIEEINKIQLEGKMYFEYKDKVISKRRFNKLISCGLLLSLLSICGIVLSFIYQWTCVFYFGFSLFYGVIFTIIALTQKNMINCKSILCHFRKGTRLSSDGNVVVESKFNWVRFLFYLGLYILIFGCVFTFVFALTYIKNVAVIVIFSILIGINLIAFIVPIKSIYTPATKINGAFKYLYNGKYYIF
ncbi:MAG: hypothetical protein K5892_06095 [Acholeplasmatales bacterium]|nr:hypothetical protein [Acholeplasmatales bacterium]